MSCCSVAFCGFVVHGSVYLVLGYCRLFRLRVISFFHQKKLLRFCLWLVAVRRASAATRLRRWDLISLDSGILSSGGTIPLPRIHVLRGNGLKSFKVLVGE